MDILRDLADIGISPQKNLEYSIELTQQIKPRLMNNPESLAGVYHNEGFSRRLLANNGIDPINNIKLSISLYQKAREIIQDKNSIIHGMSYKNEGNSLRALAEYGVNPIECLEKSILYSQLARENGLVINSEEWAGSLVDEGYARTRIANYGIDTEENLKIAYEINKKSRHDGLKKGSHHYGISYLNESLILLSCLHNKIIRPDKRKEIIRDIIQATNLARTEGILKDTREYGHTYLNEASAYMELAEADENPGPHYQEAIKLLEISRQNEFLPDTTEYEWSCSNEASIFFELALLNVDRDNSIKRAEALLIQAEKIARKIDNKSSLITIFANKGRYYYKFSLFKEAYDSLKKAIQLIEEIRTTISAADYKKDFLKEYYHTYAFMVLTCYNLGKKDENYNKESFNYAEMVKSRVFLETLSYKVDDDSDTRGLISKYHGTLNRIRDINSELSQVNRYEHGNTDKIKEIWKQLRIIEHQKDELLNRIKTSDPGYYTLVSDDFINVNDIIPSLNGKTIIEFFITTEKTLVFIINQTLHIREIPVSKNDILLHLNNIYTYIEGIISGYNLPVKPENWIQTSKLGAEQTLKKLYLDILHPFIRLLGDEIIIIPHSLLYLLPFHALITENDEFIIQKYKIQFAFSASSLRLDTVKNGKGAVVIGNPTNDLIIAEEEAEWIAHRLDAVYIKNEGATKDNVINEMVGKEIIHFSCHGEYNYDNPQMSRIVLSDGDIIANEFLNMNLNSNLVVLSACETAKSELSLGDEFEGLVRSVQLAGSRYVVASLWKIPETSTQQFFEEFYQGEGDITKDISNRIQNAAIKLGNRYDLFYWAPFQLYGV